MQNQTDILSQPILDKIVLKPKFGFSSFMSIVSSLLMLVLCLYALDLQEWPMFGLFLLLFWVTASQIPRMFTALGHLTLTQEGLQYYSVFLWRNTYYRWDEIECFTLFKRRHQWHTTIFIFFRLKQKKWFRGRFVTLFKIHDYTPEELVDALNKRLAVHSQHAELATEPLPVD